MNSNIIDDMAHNTELAVEALSPGDQVDLKSCPYLGAHASADFEFAVVESVRRETVDCFAVTFEDLGAVGYEMGTKLKVSPQTFATWEARDAIKTPLDRMVDKLRTAGYLAGPSGESVDKVMAIVGLNLQKQHMTLTEAEQFLIDNRLHPGCKGPDEPLTSRALADQYPVKGSMPDAVVRQLYELREAQVAQLSGNSVVTEHDLRDLDRGGRVAVASLLYVKCNAAARHALLHDEHPHVRSCAVMSCSEVEPDHDSLPSTTGK